MTEYEYGNAGGRKRDVMLRFRVTEAERDLILEKMRLLHTNNLAAYLRKVAVDGYILSVDYSDMKVVADEISLKSRGLTRIVSLNEKTNRMLQAM